MTRLPRISEAEFTRQVLQLCALHGWRTIHLRPARSLKGWLTAVAGDGVGFPDLLALRGSRLIVAELKRDRTQKPTWAQEAWLAAFRLAGVPAYVWTPEDWTAIEEVLSR